MQNRATVVTAATVSAILITQVLASGGSQAPAVPAAAPIPIRAGVAQLFIDDYLIDCSSDLKRTLHQPTKDQGGNAAMIPAKKGMTLLAYGSIVFDTRRQKHVMFVQEFPSRDMYMTTSADGLTWDAARHEELTPVKMDIDLGPLPPDAKGRFGVDVFSCFYDKKDAKHPYKGWLWFANAGNKWEGIWYMRSADGANWERVGQVVDGFAQPGDTSCRVITQSGRTVYGPGDVTLFYYDEQEDRFLGLFKFFSYADIRPGYSSRCRAYVFMDRMDVPFDINRITHIELMPAMAETNGDHLFDEYYQSTAWRYESLWLGGLKVFHGHGRYPYSAADCAFLKLVVSRDGLHWKKVPFDNDAGVPEVFIPNGPEGGNNGANDGGYITDFSTGPVRAGDELLYYYSSPSYGKAHPHDQIIRGGGIFRSRLRIDGFVSVDWGTLTTKPLKLEGRNLTVNGIGPMTVRALDATGNPLAATTIESGDSLAHPVAFNGRPLGEVVPGGVVRLQFEVDWQGRLYSFKVK